MGCLQWPTSTEDVGDHFAEQSEVAVELGMRACYADNLAPDQHVILEIRRVVEVDDLSHADAAAIECGGEALSRAYPFLDARGGEGNGEDVAAELLGDEEATGDKELQPVAVGVGPC